MVSETRDRKVNTEEKIENDGAKRLPHERDESPDDQHQSGRGVMKQAASDLEQGLVDTDLRGTPGISQAVPAGGTPGQAKPQPDAADGMRGQVPPSPSKGQQQ